MSEAFTFEGVETKDASDFDEFPIGTHTCLIEECVSGHAKTGTPELRVQFRCVAGDAENRVISDWLYFTQAAAGLIASKIKAAGVKPPTDIKTAEQGPARVSGLIHLKYVDIVVRAEEYPKGSGDWKNKVKAWKPAPESFQSAPTNGAAAIGNDDDIPF